MKVFLAKYYGLLPLFLLCGFYAYRAAQFPVHDFANYYFGGHFLVHGNFSQWIYFPYEFNKAIADLGYEHIFTSYAPNTPFLALVFVPLSFLPVAVAKIIFNTISILLFVWSLKRLGDFYHIGQQWFLLVPVLFLVPIKNELLFGQVYFLLFFLVVESWMAHEKGKPVRAGIFLALATMLKIFPALLILVFVFKKQFRPLMATIVSCSILLAISILFCGTSVWIFFFESILDKASNGEISEAFVPNYQSAFMFLKQLLVFDNAQNFNAPFNHPVLFSGLVLAFKIKLIAIGFYITHNAKNSLYILSYWLLAMVLISPYGSTYTYLLLLVPAFALVKSALPDFVKLIGVILIAIISNLPSNVFIHSDFPFSFARLFALLLFLALFLWPVYAYINKKVVSALVLLPMVLVLVFMKTEPAKSHNLLVKDAPTLIYDYTISNNRLTYFYWDANGENAVSIWMENRPDIIRKIQKSQMPFEKGHVLKPMQVGDAIIYLSDLDRGNGFYTLRKMKIQ